MYLELIYKYTFKYLYNYQLIQISVCIMYLDTNIIDCSHPKSVSPLGTLAAIENSDLPAGVKY